MKTKYIIVDAEKTIGNPVRVIGQHPTYSYQNNERGPQDGMKFTTLSEKAGFEQVDIKVLGMMTAPFEIPEDPTNPLFVEFDGLEANVWQDWNDKGTVKLSVTAKGIRPVTSKKIHLSEKASE